MLIRLGPALCVMAATLVVSAPTPPAAAEDHTRPVQLRTMTWNIHHGVPNGGGPSDLERVADVIRGENPDVVTLNEVHDDEDADGSHGHQPALLRDLLEPAGYAYSFYGVAEVHGEDHPGTTGQMILSKYPIYDAPGDPRSPEVVELPTQHAHPGEPNRRALVRVTLDVPGGRDVRVYATHLSAPFTDAHELDQHDQVRTILDNVPRTWQPLVLAGDFNVRPADETRPWLAEAGFVDTWTVRRDSADGVTRPNSYGNPNGDHPDRRIDYIYSSLAMDIRDTHMSLVDRDASDHLAVVADLLLRDTSVVAGRSVLAGDVGWAQLAHRDDGRAYLTVCKNAGTDVDDGWAVEARVYRDGRDEPIRVEPDAGTSRDRCQTAVWRAAISSALETCLVRGDDVTQCRRARVRAY